MFCISYCEYNPFGAQDFDDFADFHVDVLVCKASEQSIGPIIDLIQLISAICSDCLDQKNVLSCNMLVSQNILTGDSRSENKWHFHESTYIYIYLNCQSSPRVEDEIPREEAKVAVVSPRRYLLRRSKSSAASSIEGLVDGESCVQRMPNSINSPIATSHIFNTSGD